MNIIEKILTNPFVEYGMLALLAAAFLFVLYVAWHEGKVAFIVTLGLSGLSTWYHFEYLNLGVPITYLIMACLFFAVLVITTVYTYHRDQYHPELTSGPFVITLTILVLSYLSITLYLNEKEALERTAQGTKEGKQAVIEVPESLVREM